MKRALAFAVIVALAPAMAFAHQSFAAELDSKK